MRLYHGTTKENAEAILKTGFKKYTYFTSHLDSAIEMGGEYVFVIQDSKVSEQDCLDDGWQRAFPRVIRPEEIISLLRFEVNRLYFNRELYMVKQMEETAALEGDCCEKCYGTGDVKYDLSTAGESFMLPRGASFHTPRNLNRTKCPYCHGYGSVTKKNEMLEGTEGKIVLPVQSFFYCIFATINQPKMRIKHGIMRHIRNTVMKAMPDIHISKDNHDVYHILRQFTDHFRIGAGYSIIWIGGSSPEEWAKTKLEWGWPEEFVNRLESTMKQVIDDVMKKE